jgi:NADPH:quinone reductase-like Zn-dependent oxidoreductase
MKAMVQERYGSPDHLELRDVPTPVVGPDEVLVRVRAAAVNPLDWHLLRGKPYVVHLSEGLRRPKQTIPGVDLAGTVEAVGSDVRELKVGDDVFGSRSGAFSEYVCGTEAKLVAKPASISFEQAAAIPCAGLTALQALRDKGTVTPGNRVLVTGAGGGVGTFAVQLAKALGATVTGVCSAGNVELVESLGADRVLDYAVTDFTTSGDRYDCILDTVGNRSISAYRRALAEEGTLVLVGASPGNWVGPFAPMLKAMIVTRFVRQTLTPMLAQVGKEDLETLAAYVEDGAVTPAVGRTYALSEAADAIRYVETGHARAKVVLTV